jgi:DNA-binding response OmpR family regulator
MAAGTTDAPSIKQINLLIMSSAIYQLKCQLQRQHSNMAMLFVVAGASIIAAAIIVQSSVTRFRFGSSAFTRAGFRVEHAANGNQAVARTTRQTAVVLFDLVMPETHGFHCLRDIRKSSSSTKVIAITRKRHTQDPVLCRKLGAYDSLTKPLDPNEVVEIVARAVRNEPVASADFALSA